MRAIANSYVRRACAVVMVVIATAIGAGCDEGDDLLVPVAEGTLGGVVTIDGAGAPGVTVTVSDGRTATTGATGAFLFARVQVGAYTVSISGFPSDVSFPATTQAAVVASAGQVVAVNFAGSRISVPGSTTHNGTLSFAGGDASHNSHVFNAPQPKSASLTRHSTGATGIRLTPLSGFSPSTLPELTGTVSGTAVSLSGSGTIAGVNGVSVTATGTLVNGRLDITITVGADGKLPGGQPIQYRYVDN
ncbi:MAG TPA: carboxypeptidase-like regulatory domain-containing protein [Vicinamibacterales bacterium]|nr:carboxypeptidase-like regulatory domain-containing protein [Vicinamibacterales bacterium]